MYNMIMGEEVIRNIPNSEITSPENNEYFENLYNEVIQELAELWDQNAKKRIKE